MLVTCDTSQSAISTAPAGPQFTHGLEQHATPVGSPRVGSKQLSTASLSSARSAKGAANAPGTTEGHQDGEDDPGTETKRRPCPMSPAAVSDASVHANHRSHGGAHE